MSGFTGLPPLFPDRQPENFVEIWKQSSNYNPLQEQKVQGLSRALNVDENVVRGNTEEYEALFASKQLYNDTVAQNYPVLYRKLQDIPFVAAARDDMGNLIETEGWWNEISNAYNVARDTVEIGRIGTRAMLDGRDLYPYERRKFMQARQRQRAHMESEPGFLAAAAELAGTMQETLLASGATGAAVGAVFPPIAPLVAGSAAFATSFNLEAGNLYAELVTEYGYTPAQAAAISGQFGAAIAGFESLGIRFASAPLRELGKEFLQREGRNLLLREQQGQIAGRIFKDFAKGVVAESTTEGVQEVLSELGKFTASERYRPDNLYEPEYYETFKQAFFHTMKGMVILGGVPSAVRLANDSVRSASANYDYEKAKESAEIRGRSKSREAQTQVDAESGETTTLNSSYYVRAQNFKAAMNAGVEQGVATEKQIRDTIEANNPGLMAKIDEAAERDGEVELSKAEFEKTFDNTIFREAALNNTAFEEDGLTKLEAEEVDKARKKMTEGMDEETARKLQDLEKFERELREVRREVTSQLREVLKGTDAELTLNAAANASMLIGFIRRAALQRNISPREFVEKHLPQIVQRRLDGQQQGDVLKAGQQPSRAQSFLSDFEGDPDLGYAPLLDMSEDKPFPLYQQSMFGNILKVGPGEDEFIFFAMSEASDYKTDADPDINRRNAEERPDDIYLSGMKAAVPKKGIGTKALDVLRRLADKHGTRILLMPDNKSLAGSRKNLSLKKLQDWYRKNGFKPWKEHRLEGETDEQLTARIGPRVSDDYIYVPENYTPSSPVARPDTLQSSTFASALAQGLGDLNTQSARAASWKQQIESLKKKGVKQDEIEWSGILDWLEMQEGKVTKEELMAFLEKEGVKVETIAYEKREAGIVRRSGVSMSEQQDSETETTREYVLAVDGGRRNLPRVTLKFTKLQPVPGSETKTGVRHGRVEVLKIEHPSGASAATSVTTTEDAVSQLEEQLKRKKVDERWQAFRPVEGVEETLREEARALRAKAFSGVSKEEKTLLLNRSGQLDQEADEMAVLEYQAENAINDALAAWGSQLVLDPATPESTPGGEPKYAFSKVKGGENYREVIVRLFEPGKSLRYTEGHFNSNTLVHLRLTTRYDKNGRAILFLEELQSDWGQEARKEGLGDPTLKEERDELAFEAKQAAARLENLYTEAGIQTAYNEVWSVIHIMGQGPDEITIAERSIEKLYREDQKIEPDEDLSAEQKATVRELVESSVYFYNSFHIALVEMDEKLKGIAPGPFIATNAKASLKILKEKREIQDKKTGKLVSRTVPVGYEVYYGTNEDGTPHLHRSYKDRSEAEAEIQRLDSLKEKTANTQGWLDLGLKKLLQIAVDEGFDAIAITSGEDIAIATGAASVADRMDVFVPGDEGYTYRSSSENVQNALDGLKKGQFLVRIKIKGGGSNYAVVRLDEEMIVTRSDLGDQVIGEPLSKVVGAELASALRHKASVRKFNREQYTRERVEMFMEAAGNRKASKAKEAVREAVNDQMFEETEVDQMYAFQGDGLVLNKESMEEWYENIIPKSIAKILKKTGGKLSSRDVYKVGERISIEIDDKLRNSVQAGLSLFSKDGQERVLGQAEVQGGKAITKILLDPNAKPTTLMHELMHWNLELMAEIGLDIEGKLAQEDYTATALEEQMLNDIQRLLKWSGFKGTLTEWRAMTIDQRREYHEVVAMSFERYLYEGVAPSRELRGVFSRLLAYIAGRFESMVKDFQATYNKIRKDQGKPEQPLPGLNPEVRAIFGRMMSAERDVQAFFAESELDAMMMTKKEWTDSGRDAAEYEEYEQEFKDALSEATAELTIQRMKEVKTFVNAYELVAQKQRGELARISKEIRQEVQAEVEVESVYQFVSWMRKGTYKIKSGTVEPIQQPSSEKANLSRKLNAAIVKAVAPDLYDKLASRGLVSKNGVTLEKVRNMFGFESNRAMLEALAAHRNIKEEVLHRTNQRLLNEHTDLMDPVVQQENIHRAVHNKIRRRVVARELKFLLNNGRRTKVELETAKNIAMAQINRVATGDINIVAYKRAAVRARKRAMQALKDGDMQAAAFAKRQELVNEQMIEEGLKARKEVRSLVESNKRAFKHRTDKALAGAGYDVTVMKALRAVLARMGIGSVDFDTGEALARFAKEDPEFAEEVGENIGHLLKLPISQPRVGDRRKPMEHLTLKDVRVLRLLSARMMLRAKNKLSAKIGEKKQRISDAQDAATESLEKNVSPGTKDLDGKKSIFGKIRNYLSDLIRFEHLFRRADGGKVGIWTQMFRMIKDAGNRYRQEFKEFAENFGNRLRALDLSIPGGVRELEMVVGGKTQIIGQNGRNVKSQLIHLAMHYYGNASNRERLVRGYLGQKATPQQMESGEADIKKFLDEQIRQGLLTRADFEFMQETFRQLSGADMLGRAQKVMLNLRHYEMNTIEAEKFSIQFPDGEAVEFDGGYIPVRYDTSATGGREGDAQGLQDEDMSIDQQAKRMLSILPSFTKDRTSPQGDPLELNLANIQHHAAEVFRFIHMSEPVTEVYKVVNGVDVRRAFIERFGTKAYRNMEGWLKRSAYQKFDTEERTEVGNMMLTMARNANKGVMFLNIGNALQNYAGLVIPMRRVGARRIISAFISNMFSKGPRIEAIEKSTELKLRVERQIFDIYIQQNQLLTQESGIWDKISDWSNRYAYFLQQWTQNHVDVAVWQAAYNQETERALQQFMGDPDGAEKAEARAVAYADSIVRQTQMAGEKEDLSNFESQGSIYRAMFPFKSWFINWMNNAANQGRLDLDKQGQAKAAALASSYMYLLMLPAMLALAATELARGEDWDDDDDGYGDDMFELWWRSQAEQITGGLPVVQDVTRVMDTFWFDDEYWNNRYPATPWQRVVENLAKAPLKKDAIDATGSLVSQLADLMGVPASRVWKTVNLLGDEFIREDLESESTYDFLRGAVTGQRSDLQRLSR